MNSTSDGTSQNNAESVEGLFDDYTVDTRFFDEMFSADGKPYPHCELLWKTLHQIPPDNLLKMQSQVEQSFRRDGITFSVASENAKSERIIPIDCLPRLIRLRDWNHIDAGLKQRLKALNLFLHDIYNEAKILNDGVIPVEMIYGCPQYRPEMRGITLPQGVHVSICGTDLVRDNDGFKVLEDNLRVPSGVSYMLANRKAVKSNLRQLFRQYSVQSIENYGALLRQTLNELAPHNTDNPCVVVLTPGVHNSAFYEHVFLAREMGVEIVQGQDLLVHNGFVYMRTTRGLKRVDVIYRRVDDLYIDPLAFMPDSQLGVPGLFHAFRLGNVAIANAPGTGVADDKSVYNYVPDIIRYYLAEEPILSNVKTYLCRNPEDLEYTLDNLEKLVVKMVGESGGYGMLVGPHATPEARDEYAREIREDPANFIAQPTLDLSRMPCLTPNGAAPRHVDLRPFILQAKECKIVPGGFCRVALTEGSLVVNSSQGGGGKDFWVVVD